MKTPKFLSSLPLFRILSLGKKAFLLAFTALLVFGLAFSVPTGVAFAAAVTPALSNAALTKAYQHDQSSLSVQQTNLGKANDVVAVVQNLITQAGDQSIDATALASALVDYQSQLAAAQSSHTSAASVLSNHAGFDAAGNVTDPVAAASTVQSATSDLQNAHKDLVAAMQYLLKAVKLFAKANPTFFYKVDALMVSYQDEQAWLTAAQVLDFAAANILSTHTGFDLSGNVTDTAAAAITVNTARTNLQSARDTLVHTGDLLHALTLWHATCKSLLHHLSFRPINWPIKPHRHFMTLLKSN